MCRQPASDLSSNQGIAMAGVRVVLTAGFFSSVLVSMVSSSSSLVSSIVKELSQPALASDPCGPSSNGRNNLYGYGVVDALAAVQAALGRP